MNILCGYNVNIDSVYRIRGEEFTELLNSNPFFQARTEILKKIEKPPEMINSLSDFAAGLARCMKMGCGAEWLGQSPLVLDFLKDQYLEKSLVRMGGNAGIMANVLSELGAFKVVSNIAVPSKAQLSLFSKKGIQFPGLPGKKPSTINTSAKLIRQKEAPIHFVFDFSKGDRFSLFGKEVSIPRENRFIASFDELNLKLYINPAFENYALQHIKEMDGALLSGFHILLENYPEGFTYLDRLEKAFSQIKTWKTQNKKLAVHVELGHFSSLRIARDVFVKFAEVSDSLGMNEEELAMLKPLHKIPQDEIIKRNIQRLSKAALTLAVEYDLSRLLIHTREFGLSVFKEKKELNNGYEEMDIGSKENLIPKKEFEALDFGLSCAAAFAASGKLKGRNFVKKVAASLPRSNFGNVKVQEFLEAFEGKPFQKGAFAHFGDYTLCMLPTLLCKTPVSTVGLGDTFTASFFLRRLELHVQA